MLFVEGNCFEMIEGLPKTWQVVKVARNKILPSEFKLLQSQGLFVCRGDPEAVEILFSDIQRLDPFEFLNDTVIDFYIKYVAPLLPLMLMIDFIFSGFVVYSICL